MLTSTHNAIISESGERGGSYCQWQSPGQEDMEEIQPPGFCVQDLPQSERFCYSSDKFFGTGSFDKKLPFMYLGFLEKLIVYRTIIFKLGGPLTHNIELLSLSFSKQLKELSLSSSWLELEIANFPRKQS